MRCLHLFEVQESVLRPVDVADHPARQLVRVGVVILGEGQQKCQNPDDPNDHFRLCCRHPLLQGMNDGHISVEEQDRCTEGATSVAYVEVFKKAFLYFYFKISS